ncbi:hypothetical protein LSAT2_005249 [Lamellibrachia satsuma]|nr:hypothetical protein LSAT2_005249 [Lamellibrachia satsuma]
MKTVIFTVVFASAVVGSFALTCDKKTCIYDICKDFNKERKDKLPICDEKLKAGSEKCKDSGDKKNLCSTVIWTKDGRPCMISVACLADCKHLTSKLGDHISTTKECCAKDNCNNFVEAYKSSAIIINVAPILVFLSMATLVYGLDSE